MINAIMALIGTIIYPLFSIIFVLIDGVQALFQAFAGTGKIRYGGVGLTNSSTVITGDNTGAETDTGIVYYLFQSTLIKNLFMSILILALFLIIVFTVMAFIKNAYSSKPKKWQDIVGNAFVGLANFIFIPVCCLLGVWLSNILLKAIDGATNISGATSMSRQLFLSAAYNANDFRLKIDDYTDNYDKPYNELLDIIGYINENGEFEGGTGLETNKAPQITVQKQTWTTEEEYQVAMEYYADIVDQYYGSEGVSIYEYHSVEQGYSLISINYFILAGGGGFILYALGAISFGMVKRLFTLLMLFVISPALCALYPLDDGKAVGSWKGDFIKNTISAYGAVAGLNIFFSIAPVIQNIKLFSSGGLGWMMDALGLTSLLLTACGLFMVKDFISMISGYIGAGNAFADGSSLMSNVNKKTGLGALGKGSMKALTKAGGAFGAARKEGKSGLISFGKSIGMSALLGGHSLLKSSTGIDFLGAGKEIAAAGKEGKGTTKTGRLINQFEDLQKLLEKLNKGETIEIGGKKYDGKLSLDKEAATKLITDEMEHISQQLNLSSVALEEAAKKIGASSDALKESLSGNKALVGAGKSYAEGIQYHDWATNWTVNKKNIQDAFGINLADLFNGFGTNDALQKSKIVDIMLHGGDVKQLGGLATGASAEALRIFESVSSQVRGSDFMGSGFIETLKSGKFIGLDGKPIKIDPSELSKIQAALRSNAVSGVTDSDGNAIAKFDELLRTIKEGKTLSASSPEMEKLIKILSQNAEMDKQVKGELRNLKAGLESSKAKSKK